MARAEDVDYQLSGVPRMHERPIGDLVDALRGLGCVIDYLGQPGFPPLHIGAANPRQPAQPVLVRGDVSSQFLSALLMALPLSGRAQRIEVVGELISKPYVELTLALMRRFGIAVVRHGWQAFDVPAQNYQSPGTVFVEGDASSASYFLAAGVLGGLLPQGASSTPVRIEGVGRDSIQGDVRFAEVLERMGGQLRMGPNWIEAETGPTARRAGHLQPLDMDLNHIPDAAMTAAVLALFAQGTSRLRNIGSWRVKETDRIAAMACELRKLGAQVEEGADFLAITPPRVWQSASIDTYDDHRMAMCFSLAALGGVALRIHDPACVGKTFPDYFAALASITGAKGSA
jgi:3-phosphoshikimate 1-carboxyvinyltransferase